MSIDDESVTTLDDLKGDLARRYKSTPSSGASVDPAIVNADLAALDRDGYVIWENLLSPEECEHIRDVVGPWLMNTGRNSFEGRRTRRIYSVVSRTRVCDRLVDHPRVLAVLDRLLMPNYLLSALQVIDIEPGESAQLAHHDDGFYPLPRPRAPLGAATIWAIDDFTADNGATVVLPGSHRWGQASAGLRRSRTACRHARRLVCLLHGNPLAWGRRQHHHPRAACRHRPILRTVAATDGGLHPLGAARHRSNRLR